MTDAQDRYPLADMLAALGDQIREAERRHRSERDGDLLRFKEAQIELGVSWEKKGDGGIELWVIKLGGGVDKTNTQTIRVTLEPVADGVVEFAPAE